MLAGLPADYYISTAELPDSFERDDLFRGLTLFAILADAKAFHEVSETREPVSLWWELSIPGPSVFSVLDLCGSFVMTVLAM